MTGPKLKFCPESNDLLYPKEDRVNKKLVYQCRNCPYVEDADPSEWCVYRNEIQHSSKEKLVVLQASTAGAPCSANCSHAGLGAVPLQGHAGRGSRRAWAEGGFGGSTPVRRPRRRDALPWHVAPVLPCRT